MTDSDYALSLEELATTLAAYAGPEQPRTRHARQRWMSRRLAVAIALVVMLIAGCSYAAHFNPFAGISAADRPATPSDRLPASLVSGVADWNRKSPGDRLLVSTARFVRELPNGMRFYAIAARTGTLCVAFSHPPRSFSPGAATANSGFVCGSSLRRDDPVSITNEMNGSYTPSGKQILGKQISFGVALDGITAITFSGGRLHATVPVRHNVWAHLGPLGERRVILHWKDGSTERLWSSPVDGTWSTRRSRTLP